MRGFTLIELLVAMTILALTATVLFSGLRLAVAASERVDANARQMERIHLTQRFLRKEIEQIGFTLAGAGTAAALDGEEDRLAFTAPLLARGDYEGFYRFRLGLGADSERQALVMHYSPLGGAQDEQLVLIEDVTTLRFDYWDGRAWRAVWHETDRLPSLVRIRAERSTGRALWPDLIATLRLRPPVGPNDGRG